MDFLSWLENTGFAQWVASDPLVNPILLCLHAVGMGSVVGVTWMLSLRVFGLASGLSLRAFRSINQFAVLGFIVNATSGVILFTSAATRLIVNANFQLKMACILLGGFSLWFLGRALASLDVDEPKPTFPASAKVGAALASLLWLTAIVSGRYIAYTLAPPPL